MISELLTVEDELGGCGSVDSVLDFEPGDSKFESHCRSLCPWARHFTPNVHSTQCV